MLLVHDDDLVPLVGFYCQGLAGPWYVQRECGSVKARFSEFRGCDDLDEGVSPS